MKKKRTYKKYKPIQPYSFIVLKAIIAVFVIYQVMEYFLMPSWTYEVSILIPLLYFVIAVTVNAKRKGQQRKEYYLYRGSNIKNVDKLNGEEFERYLRAHFKRLGYKVELTPPQKDYGVDLILSKGKDRIAVQAKRYNHEAGYKVNYRAVQEVAAGKAYYNCNKGIVVTNSFFTISAKELAEVNQIDLWDRKRMVMEFQTRNAPWPYEYKKEYCS